ncbi:hypothetical protein [Streptomyces sp. NPDC059491]|uniref:hypothetical protein n=1 Tax=Streptomyces sp. NPDC059491 TaxID=3346850 RepID=UPI0036823E4F
MRITSVLVKGFLGSLVSALLLASCSTGSRDRVARDPYPYWEPGAGAREAADFMKVKVPTGATEVKGAVQVNPQEDVYILSFRTDRATAIEIATDLRPEKPPTAWNISVTPASELFGHLGLPEPDTLKGSLRAGVCPPCAKDYRRRNVAWVDIYIETLHADQARVYLHAF